jgi:formylglycine-generating enzyme required for sulfatase activity
MRMFLRLALVSLISLWLGSVAYADKICPVGSEVYPDSVQYCIQHGNKLIPKKTVPSKNTAPSATRIHVYFEGSQKEVFDFGGFNTECDGYGKEGSRYTENAVSVNIPWWDFIYILPEYGRAKLKNGYDIESDSLKRENCSGAQIREKRKRKALIAGNEKEKEETVEMALSRIEVLSFEEKGLEDGRAVREVILQKREKTGRIAEEGKKPSTAEADGRAEEEKRRQEAEAGKVAEEKKRQAEEEAKKRAEAEAARQISEQMAGEFVFVKGGCYRMGDTFGDGRPDERPVHEVCVNDFYLGKYEVTQGQWQGVMGYNPAYHKNGDEYPVEQVSWNDVQGFIRKLSDKTGQFYRLPTEAEWEYAARSGGKPERYSGGDAVDALAWYRSTSGGKSHPVGTKAPNGLGIHDMSGNVWEWVQDWYGSGYYSGSPRDNPKGPSSGTHRVARGGGWSAEVESCSTTDREYLIPAGGNNSMGFRLVRTR